MAKTQPKILEYNWNRCYTTFLAVFFHLDKQATLLYSKIDSLVGLVLLGKY